MELRSRQSLLEVSQLELRFQTKLLLSDFNFSLEPGEKISMRGKSGSGKSSLLRCILGFIIPASGSIFFKGEELSEKNIWTLRRCMGYVPQEPDLGDLEVLAFLEKPFQYKANHLQAFDRFRLKELFAAFHLEEDLLHKSSRLLSGGEKQRIAMISALLLDREFYLFDEATSALDADTRLAIVTYLHEMQELSALFVTHDPHLLELSDKVLAIGNHAAEEI